jgi:hypothetical protein
MMPSDRYISADTKLNGEQMAILLLHIKRKEDKLRRIPRGEFELILWEMDQLEHVRNLRDFNLKEFEKEAA